MQMINNVGISLVFGSRSTICRLVDAYIGICAVAKKVPFLSMGVLAVLLMGSAGVDAADHYVRAGATGSNNGSDWSNAYNSLPATLVRGDTYYIAAGSYGGYTFDDAVSGTNNIYIKKAIGSAHGIDTGWNSIYANGQATFTGWKFNTGYYDIDGVTGGGPGNWETNLGIKVIGSSSPLLDFNAYGADNIKIRHVEATSSYGRNSSYDIWVVKSVKDDASGNYFSQGQGMSNVLFEYCYFHDVGGGHFHTFNMNGVTIQYNKLQRNGENHPELHREVWSAVGDDSVIWRWNWIEDSTNTAVFAYVNGGGVSNAIEIYGNVILQTGLQGTHASFFVDGSGGSEGHIPTNWKIYNNTIVGWISGEPGIMFNPNGSGNVTQNNIWALHPASDPIVLSGTHNYNCFYSIIHWQTQQDMAPGLASGESNGQLFTSNPFFDSSVRNYRLIRATNPGVSLPAPYNVDMFGTIRGADGVWDRGAFEYQSGSPTPPPKIPNSPTIIQVY